MAKDSYYYGLGRRKSATAQVRLTTNGKGNFIINDKPSEDYLGASKYLRHRLLKPMNVLELDIEKYNLSIKVSGGGTTSQIDAAVLGISKALVALNEEYKPTLKRADLLGRDPREKERKKFGLKGARKQRQFTKR